MRDIFLGLIFILLIVVVCELNMISLDIKRTFQIDVD